MQYFRFKGLSFIRHLQKGYSCHFWEYSAQLTDDISDDESKQPSSKWVHSLGKECADDIDSIPFGYDSIDASASWSSSRGKKSKIQQEMDIHLSDPLVQKASYPLAW